MSDVRIEDKLAAIFSNVNDWLKFAEQKNAALLVLNGGLVWGVARIWPGFHDLCSVSFVVQALGYSAVVLSGLICLISFMPILTRPLFNPGAQSDRDNCHYFGHIAKYSSIEYLMLLSKRLGIQDPRFTGYEIDYANQIVVNSAIALEKYRRFKTASFLTIAGILLFGGSRALSIAI